MPHSAGEVQPVAFGLSGGGVAGVGVEGCPFQVAWTVPSARLMVAPVLPPLELVGYQGAGGAEQDPGC